ncbi:hypothetical protein BDZ45DRAFT_748204 [Acephala macrosclerotiorum]|nr:hypothetical protein BDZ45DRAFT_748204 [Acephala macrosclerotiorum]
MSTNIDTADDKTGSSIASIEICGATSGSHLRIDEVTRANIMACQTNKPILLEPIGIPAIADDITDPPSIDGEKRDEKPDATALVDNIIKENLILAKGHSDLLLLRDDMAKSLAQAQIQNAEPEVLVASLMKNGKLELRAKPAIGTAFHLFPELPVELRLQIWEAARPEGRVIRITRSKHEPVDENDDLDYEWYTKANVPALLHASSESRRVALQWYQLSFGFGPQNQSTIYFDHSRDWTYLQCVCYSARCLNPITDLSEIPSPLPAIKRLVYEFDDVHCCGPFHNMWRRFPNAEQATMLDSSSDNGLGSRWEAGAGAFKPNNKVFLTQTVLWPVPYESQDLLTAYTAATDSNVLKSLTAVEYDPVVERADVAKGSHGMPLPEELFGPDSIHLYICRNNFNINYALKPEACGAFASRNKSTSTKKFRINKHHGTSSLTSRNDASASTSPQMSPLSPL